MMQCWTKAKMCMGPLDQRALGLEFHVALYTFFRPTWALYTTVLTGQLLDQQAFTFFYCFSPSCLLKDNFLIK